MSPVFIYNRICGELVVQAERKVRPSTHRPDVDNAAVGNAFLLCYRRIPYKGVLLFFILEKGGPKIGDFALWCADSARLALPIRRKLYV